MQLSFITPPSEYLYNPFRGDQHCQMQLLTILEQNYGDRLGLSLIDLRGVKENYLPYHVPERDVYLHSVYTLDFNQQVKLVKDLKEAYPKAKHVAGGPHVNLFPEEALKHFDSIVLGDAEETINSIINDAFSGNLQRIYHQETPIDINNYPYAKRHFVPKSSTARKGMMTIKNNKEYEELLGTTVVFTRGCLYKCSFCAIPQIRSINPKMRARSPENIEAEIEYLKKEYGIQGISLHDEIGIPLDRKQAISRLEALARTGIIWRGQCRVDGITSEIAQLMRESGCIAMGLGIESASQQALDMINKKIDVERSKETIRILKEKGIAPRLYMIMGLPGEPENISEITWNFLQETKPDVVFMHLFTPRPGTEVYDSPDKFGIESVGEDWSKNNHLFYAGDSPEATFKYKDITPWGRGRKSEQIVADYKEMLERIQEAGMSPYPPKRKEIVEAQLES